MTCGSRRDTAAFAPRRCPTPSATACSAGATFAGDQRHPWTRWCLRCWPRSRVRHGRASGAATRPCGGANGASDWRWQHDRAKQGDRGHSACSRCPRAAGPFRGHRPGPGGRHVVACACDHAPRARPSPGPRCADWRCAMSASTFEHEPLLCTSCAAPLAVDSPDGRCGPCARAEERLYSFGLSGPEPVTADDLAQLRGEAPAAATPAAPEPAPLEDGWLEGSPMDPLAVPAEPLAPMAGYPFLPASGGACALLVSPTGAGKSEFAEACAYDGAKWGVRTAYLGHEVSE